MFLAAGDCSPGRASDLPPAGRSLFDHLTSRRIDERIEQRVPYPFQALLAELETRAGTDRLGRPGVAAVLIPLGRSLQRNASPGDYFAHPRIVAAITGEVAAVTRAAPLLRDRIFLGFQDETGIVEVISYNERAGRFEFQVVTDYRRGATPKVFYARRAVCTTCHHGAAPIFSRPSWDETNANPAVARALGVHAKSFHGVPVARGVDVPNAIDDAVARANRIALMQTIWRDGCARVAAPNDPALCRAEALLAALRLRLTERLGRSVSEPAAADQLRILAAAWQATWPDGLPEPDPNIPNRDPFFGGAQQLGITAARLPYAADEIPPALDPMANRPPVAVWRADAAGIDRFVRTLAEMLAASDIAQLARGLASRRAASAPARPARLAGSEAFPANDHYDFDRLQHALAALAADSRAGRSDVLGNAAFQRTPTLQALFTHLGLPADSVCCDFDERAWPPARLEHDGIENPAARSTPLEPFYEHCGVCHAGPSESPPGFLFGSAASVERNLSRCAARIRYRLAMWRVAEGARAKVPMPPPVFVPSWNHAPPHDALDRMVRYVDARLDAATRERLLTLRYETLPACRESGGSIRRSARP